MAKNNDNSGKLNYKENLDAMQKAKEIQDEMGRSFTSFLNNLENSSKLQKEINKLEQQRVALMNDLNDASDEQTAEIHRQLKESERTILILKKTNSELSRTKGLWKSIGNETKAWASSMLDNFSDSWKYILEADGAIHELNNNLGLSGAGAERMTNAMIEGAKATATFGIGMKELAQIQKSYADETGRIAGLSAESARYVAEVAAGTSLGEEGAGRLAGQFQNIGKSAKEFNKFAEETLNTSEAMGVNSGNVMKKISENFDKIHSYRFQNGVKGLADMAKYSERFKVNMADTFSSIDKARTIEGAIEMASKLQVMGGRFAAGADPFGLAYMARNKPEEFMKHLNNMTKGIATFNKTTGQFDISSLDLDRLRQVAEATGKDFNNLTEEVMKMGQVEYVGTRMLGFNKDDRELVSMFSEIQKDGKVMVDVNGEKLDISKLTDNHIKMLKANKTTMEARAELAQSFDKEFQNTILELKSQLLPIIKWLNEILKSLNGWTEGMSPLAGALTKFAVMGATMGVGGFLLSKGGIKMLESLTSAGGNVIGKIFSKKEASTVTDGGANKSIEKASESMGKVGEGIGKIGGGAFSGISKGIASGIRSIGVAAGGAAPGLMSFGVALLEIGGAIALAGAGIGVAMYGIGFMFEKASMLGGSGAGDEILKIASSLSMLTISATLGVIPIAGMFATLWAMSSLDFSNFNSFDSLNSLLQSDLSKLDKLKETLEAISKVETNKLEKLSSVFKEGIKVKFDETQSANFTINLTNQIDTDKITTTIRKKIGLQIIRSKEGTGN